MEDVRTEAGFEERVRTLRRLETYCYQLTRYLLQDETMAMEAAKSALLHIFKESDFFEKTAEAQQEYTKRIAVRASVQVKNSNNEGGVVERCC